MSRTRNTNAPAEGRGAWQLTISSGQFQKGYHESTTEIR